MNKILFICTGNYYRSRFAEALFNHLAAEQALPWHACSRGLGIHLVDGDLSPHTEGALRERAIPRGRTGTTRVSLSEADLLGATRVIALKEAEHRRLLREQFPGWEDRVEYWHVHDLDAAGPESAIPEIEALVTHLIQTLTARKDGPHVG